MAEMILGAASMGQGEEESERYLGGRVRYEGEERLMDEEDEGVMMAWEAPLMEAHASLLCGEDGDRDVLNVGFGMGIIDRAIQSLGCRSHTIIEAHPDVLAKARAEGWGDKEGVTLVEGRWQEAVGQLVQRGRKFDAIFFDTYAEHYRDMQVWHRHLPSLLRPGGVYSFFNGLAPDNQFFHAVACQMVKLELEDLGFDVDFFTAKVEGGAADEETWKGIKRRYWHGRDEYYLPHAVFARIAMDTAEEEEEGGGGGGGGGMAESATADDTLVGVATLADGVTTREVLLRPSLDSLNGGLQWLPMGLDADRSSPLALGPLRTWYPPMLHDGPRNRYFKDLVTEAVKQAAAGGGEGPVVLDVGTGTGLLSLWAAEAGASHVTAVEGNPALVEVARQVVGRARGGQEGVVKVVAGRSQERALEELLLPRPADVMVAELLDSTLLAEGFVPAVRDAKARGLVRQGAVIAPLRARVWGRLVECAFLTDLAYLRHGNGGGEEAGRPVVAGLGQQEEEAEACARSGRGSLLPLHVEALVEQGALRYLSEPFQLLDIDFDALTDINKTTESAAEALMQQHHPGATVWVDVQAPGTVHAVLVYWDLPTSTSTSTSSGSNYYTTAPWARAEWQDHWRPCVWPVWPPRHVEEEEAAGPSSSASSRRGGKLPVRAAHDDSTIWLAVGDQQQEDEDNKTTTVGKGAGELPIPSEPLPCLCGLHGMLGQPETGLPVERFASLNHYPTNLAWTTAIRDALTTITTGGVVLDVSDGGRAALIAASLLQGSPSQQQQQGVSAVVSLETHSLHRALLSRAEASSSSSSLSPLLHVWGGASMGEPWRWGGGEGEEEEEPSVSLLVGDCFYQRIGVNRPVWSALNFWFLRTALSPVLRGDVVVMPFQARVMVALVEFPHLATAHGLPVPDVGGFDHSPLREGMSKAEEWAASDEDKDLPVWATVEHPHRLLTPPALLLTLDLHREVSFRQAESLKGVYRTGRVVVPVTAEEEGEAHAVMMWVDYDLTYEAAVSGEGAVVSGYDGRGGARQAVRWLKERRRVRGGEDVMRAEASVNVINPEVRATFTILPARELEEEQQRHSRHDDEDDTRGQDED